MPEISALKVIIDGLKTSLMQATFKNNVLQQENKELKELLRKKKKLWVDLSEDDLHEIGVDGPTKQTWVRNAEEKLKELNT